MQFTKISIVLLTTLSGLITAQDAAQIVRREAVAGQVISNVLSGKITCSPAQVSIGGHMVDCDKLVKCSKGKPVAAPQSDPHPAVAGLMAAAVSTCISHCSCPKKP
jgi:hypothetical protein